MEDTFSVEEASALAPSADVEIRIGPRAVYGVIGLLGLLMIFGVGLWLGLNSRRGGTQALAPPVQAIQQPAFRPVPQPFLHPDANEVPSVIRPAPDHAPDGDHPHLAIPELAASDYVFDFGDIGPDEPVARVLTIKNTGTQDLVISRTGTSWGCTASLVSDKVVPPGDETVIRITHDPRIMKDERGPVLRYVDIFSNDPAAAQVRFAVRTNILD